MMKFLVVIVVILIAFPTVYAQKIQVLSEDNSPLPYATIFNKSQQKAYFTKDDGTLHANFNQGDSIEISFVGYRSLKTEFKASPIVAYALHRSVMQLENVTVKNCTNWKPVQINNLADSGGSPFGGVEFTYSTIDKALLGVYIDTSFEGQKLKQISFWLRKDEFIFRRRKDGKNAFKAPFRLWFFAVNDSNYLPLEPLTSKHIVWHPTDTGKQTILVDSLSLLIPSTGMYVVMEYLKDEKYKFGKLSSDQNYSDSIDSFYGATIDGIRGHRFPIAFGRIADNTWTFANKKSYNEFPKVFSSIKFEIETDVCNDK